MCAAVALLAGGAVPVAVGIGVAMTLLQLGIGTVNDVVDAPRDAGRKAGKPIPAGLVAARSAQAAAIACFAAGTVLAAAISGWLGVLALVVIAVGLAYDLRLKGTPWSWLPFSVGIPILPVFGWLGAAGTLPPAFLILVPAAVAAGAALAIGNALVDVERDRAAAITSIAVALGPPRAARAAVGLLVGIAAAAAVSEAVVGAGPVALGAVIAAGAIPIVAAVATRDASSGARERAWQAEAVGLAILATVWLATILGAGGTPG